MSYGSVFVDSIKYKCVKPKDELCWGACVKITKNDSAHICRMFKKAVEE